VRGSLEHEGGHLGVSKPYPGPYSWNREELLRGMRRRAGGGISHTDQGDEGKGLLFCNMGFILPLRDRKKKKNRGGGRGWFGGGGRRVGRHSCFVGVRLINQGMVVGK